VIITSCALLVVAFVLLIVGALNGNPTMLAASLGAAGAGGLCLFLGNASARRIAVARGVPVESVLASRMRRPTAEPTGGSDASAPIDGYDDMTVTEVTRLVASGAMPDDALSDILVYEASHRRRREVLTALIDVVGPDPTAGSQEAEPAATGGSVRRRLQGGGRSSGTGPAAEALRAARQATLTQGDADDSRFARPEPDSSDVDE
jgi:hypothetical protein